LRGLGDGLAGAVFMVSVGATKETTSMAASFIYFYFYMP
jgi:hypothetical protein